TRESNKSDIPPGIFAEGPRRPALGNPPDTSPFLFMENICRMDTGSIPGVAHASGNKKPPKASQKAGWASGGTFVQEASNLHLSAGEGPPHGIPPSPI